MQCGLRSGARGRQHPRIRRIGHPIFRHRRGRPRMPRMRQHGRRHPDFLHQRLIFPVLVHQLVGKPRLIPADRQTILNRPLARLQSQNHEFGWQYLRLHNPGINPVHVPLHHRRRRSRMCASGKSGTPLRDVGLQCNGAEHFRQLPTREPPHQLHLKQTLRRVQPPNGKERIAVRLRPNLRHTLPVERNLHRSRDAGRNHAVILRHRARQITAPSKPQQRH